LLKLKNFKTLSSLIAMKFSEDLKSEKFKEIETLTVNYCASLFEEKNYQKALEKLNYLLVSTKNLKAFRIRAKCHKMLENYEEALSDVNKSLEMDNTDKISLAELKLIKMEIKIQDNKDQGKYKKVMSQIYSQESLYEDVVPKKVLFGSDGSELYF
jgi:tetratricopeptide (TPR) repeat protein